MSPAGSDNNRRLTAKLQRDWHPLFTRRPHDGAADRRAAGEKQMIERQGRESGTDSGIAAHHADLRVENTSASRRAGSLACLRRELGGLARFVDTYFALLKTRLRYPHAPKQKYLAARSLPSRRLILK